MKTNPEFEKFTGFMDKLAKVPHEELKAELDAEKQEKTTANSSLQEMANRAGKRAADEMNKLPKDHEVPY